MHIQSIFLKSCKYIPLVAVGLLLLLPSTVSASEDEYGLLIKYRGSDELHEQVFVSKEAISIAMASYALRADIEYVEPNAQYRAVLVPNDTYYGSQWSLDKAGAVRAWDSTTGDENVIIAVVDSGVQIDHPDLQENIWTNSDEVAGNGIDDDGNGFIDDVNGWDFVNDVGDPQPKFQTGWTTTGIHHGTVVAGIAAAVGNNGKGITGVSWSSTIMPIKALDDQGFGSTLSVAQGVQYAADNGADIINLSFVGGDPSTALQQAITDARAKGILVIAAAGNDNLDLDITPQYPVCNTDVIGVAATDPNDEKTSFSNYGSCVDISAPGINMYGTILYNADEGLTLYYQNGWFGTSASAPLIAGSLALVKAYNPLLPSDNIESVLLETAKDISDINPSYSADLGAGRVDLSAIFESENIITVARKIITGTDSGTSPRVRISESDGSLVTSFLGFSESFTGGVHVASGDLSGDGSYEAVIGAGSGGAPHIRIFGDTGDLLGSFYAYAEHFRGGVYVTTGDLDGNGSHEIIAGAGDGGAPHIRIFNDKGILIGTFFAFDENFRGGVHVTTGDLDGNGQDEIIVGAGNGGAPQIRIFNDKGKVLGQFFAYDLGFRGGVYVATGDVDGDGVDEIITGAGNGGGPHVRVFTDTGTVLGQFFAYDEGFRGGVRVAAGDINADSVDEIITGAGPGGGPHIRQFDAQGNVIDQYFAYEESLRTGVNVYAF